MTELTARRECLARAVAPTLYPYPTSGFVLPSLGQRVTSPHVRSPEDSPCGLRRPSRRLSWPLLWGTLSPFNGLLIDHCQPARPGQMQKGPSGLPLGRSRCPHPPAVPWTGGEECGRSLEDTARAAVHQRGNGATGAPASGPSYAHRPGVLTRGGRPLGAEHLTADAAVGDHAKRQGEAEAHGGGRHVPAGDLPSHSYRVDGTAQLASCRGLGAANTAQVACRGTTTAADSADAGPTRQGRRPGFCFIKGPPPPPAPRPPAPRLEKGAETRSVSPPLTSSARWAEVAQASPAVCPSAHTSLTFPSPSAAQP